MPCQPIWVFGSRHAVTHGDEPLLCLRWDSLDRTSQTRYGFEVRLVCRERVTRFVMRVVPTVFPDPEVLGRTLAKLIADELVESAERGDAFLLGCPGGR